MICIRGRDPTCCHLVRVWMGSQDGLIVVWHGAGKDKINLVLAFPAVGFQPVQIRDMQQVTDGDVRSDFFKTFPFQGVFQALSRLLPATWQRIVKSFCGLTFFLHQQVIPSADEGPRRGADDRAKRRRGRGAGNCVASFCKPVAIGTIQPCGHLAAAGRLAAPGAVMGQLGL